MVQVPIPARLIPRSALHPRESAAPLHRAAVLNSLSLDCADAEPPCLRFSNPTLAHPRSPSSTTHPPTLPARASGGATLPQLHAVWPPAVGRTREQKTANMPVANRNAKPRGGGRRNGDPRQPEILGQTTLPGPEAALRAAARLGRMGRDHLHPQILHGPPNLRQAVLIHLLPLLHRHEEMAAAITVQGAEQALLFDDSRKPANKSWTASTRYAQRTLASQRPSGHQPRAGKS